MRAIRLVPALGLLASTGFVGAATSSTRDVPAATLLLPHFRVARNGTQGADIPEGGIDTLVAITNTGPNGLIVHATLWNKYGRPVLGFNIPMGGHDVAAFRMKDVLNGKLNVNPNYQNGDRLPNDPCGLNVATGVYAPATGFGPARFIRFANPDTNDATHAVSIYQEPALSGAARLAVWDSLDESQDVTTFTSPFGAGILDDDNPACGSPSDGVLSGDFSGSMTFDVMNYCTGWLPTDAAWYQGDALATRGWTGTTPNVLLGDVIDVDPDPRGGVSGEPLVSLPFDEHLDWRTMPTFFGRFSTLESAAQASAAAPEGYRFVGDGRVPLASSWSFRYLSDQAKGLHSLATLYHTDLRPTVTGTSPDLCDWYSRGGPPGLGSFAIDRRLESTLYDNDENRAVMTGSCGPCVFNNYDFLESERVNLLNNGDVNPGAFRSGWAELTFLGDPRANQAYVSVQHRAAGGVSVTVPAVALRSPYTSAVVPSPAPPAAGSGAPACSTRGLPAATLLLPYFRVARNGTQGADIPEGGADTLVSVTNTGVTGLIVHATVWSKYGKPTLGFNIPLGGKDVAFFRMKDVLNGKLNVNPNYQKASLLPNDPCGLNVSTGVYAPVTGFSPTRLVRFPNPDPVDAAHAISIYQTPAFAGEARLRVWDSLDESGDVRSLMQGPLEPWVLDVDDPACGDASDGVLSGDFSGSMTFDVVNFCTTLSPTDREWYVRDALATRGWTGEGNGVNALIGDAFALDPGDGGAGVSGETLVALPFEETLDWRSMPTFSARLSALEGADAPSPAPAPFRFVGDGRMPLASGFATRFLDDVGQGLRSWLTLYHTDLWKMPNDGIAMDLCAWRALCRGNIPGCQGFGSWALDRQIHVTAYDLDGNRVVITGGYEPGPGPMNAFLETQRVDLHLNGEFTGDFRAGWAELTFDGDPRTRQAYLSVQHAAPGGIRVSVPAGILRAPYSCAPLPSTP